MAESNPIAAPPRPLAVIAADITEHWPQVHSGAVPYLQAMACLDKITDRCGCDSAGDIVLRFLYNAAGWRGPDARRLKAELRGMVSG